jgi:hypothetical protein
MSADRGCELATEHKTEEDLAKLGLSGKVVSLSRDGHRWGPPGCDRRDSGQRESGFDSRCDWRLRGLASSDPSC